MAKEFFAHDESRQLFKTVEDISRRSGVSRGQAFEDVLKACVAALAAETMEDEYFEAIKAHTAGARGERGVDLFPVFMAQLVEAMANTDADVLGDLFQGAISYGENGLYLTPEPVARLMAQLTVEATERNEDGRDVKIQDPCCGTGILLIEAGKASPMAELVGQDIDARCARITSVNLGLRCKYGWVICGNSLSREVQFVYRIGTFFYEGPNGLRRGVIRQVRPEDCPMLTEITRTTNQDLLSTAGIATGEQLIAPQSNLPIIEVPRWALRLESRLAAIQSADDEPATGLPQEQGTENLPMDDKPTAKQGLLFD